MAVKVSHYYRIFFIGNTFHSLFKACDQSSKYKQATFHQQDGIDVASAFAASLTIGSLANIPKMQCFAYCTTNCQCFMAKYEPNNAAFYLVNNTNNIGNIYMKKK